ncbi:hypothetical protein ACHAXR_002307, partial [Thalassiosira sp. AJA248-18]
MPAYQHIVTWMAHGRSWKILDEAAFATIIVGRYF